MPPFSVLNRNICYFFLVKKSCWPLARITFRLTFYPWCNFRGTIWECVLVQFCHLFPLLILSLVAGSGCGGTWVRPLASCPHGFDQRAMSHRMLVKNLKESDRHRRRQKTDKSLNLRLCLCFYLWPEKSSKRVINISICKNLQTSHLVRLHPYLMLTACWRWWWKTTL